MLRRSGAAARSWPRPRSACSRCWTATCTAGRPPHSGTSCASTCWRAAAASSAATPGTGTSRRAFPPFSWARCRSSSSARRSSGGAATSGCRCSASPSSFRRSTWLSTAASRTRSSASFCRASPSCTWSPRPASAGRGGAGTRSAATRRSGARSSSRTAWRSPSSPSTTSAAPSPSWARSRRPSGPAAGRGPGPWTSSCRATRRRRTATSICRAPAGCGRATWSALRWRGRRASARRATPSKRTPPPSWSSATGGASRRTRWSSSTCTSPRWRARAPLLGRFRSRSCVPHASLNTDADRDGFFRRVCLLTRVQGRPPA